MVMALRAPPTAAAGVSRTRTGKAVVCRAQKFDVASAAAAVVLASSLVAGCAPASALTYDEIQGLTYLQVKGSGVANTCPVLQSGSTNLKDIKAGTYQVENFCMEPSSFSIRETSQFKGGDTDFVKTKLMTRLTYTLDDISGKLTVDNGGNVTFQEEDGIDFAATTVQLPGGERVPFLFSIKQLNAKGTLDSFGGDFQVPSYRGSTFLDPKGRGASTGYDTAVGLQASGDDEEYAKENVKSAAAMVGRAVFSVARVDPETGEIAGVFESLQPSDTDLGAKAPKDVKITGIWYAQLSQ